MNYVVAIATTIWHTLMTLESKANVKYTSNLSLAPLSFLTEGVYNWVDYSGSAGRALDWGSMGCNRSGSVGRALDWGSTSCPTQGCDSLSTNETIAGEDGGSKGCYVREVRVSHFLSHCVVSLSKTLYPLQPRKTRTNISDKMLTGT